MIKERLLTRELDLDNKALILSEIRAGGMPVINLKTGRCGKGEGCPMACEYCDVAGVDGIAANIQTRFPRGEGYWQDVSQDDFSNIIRLWARHGGRTLHWCGDGEPTVFRYFDQIIELSQEYDFHLEIFSSLAGLTPQRAEQLIKSSATVKFKMDTRDPERLGSIMRPDLSVNQQLLTGKSVLDRIDLLLQARESYGHHPTQLIASIVVSNRIHQPRQHDLIEVFDWCAGHQVIPQVNYLEEIGHAQANPVTAIESRQASAINRWLRNRYNIEPKEIIGDQCQAKAAPILAGHHVFLGPFGMGCEFPLREHLGTLHYVGSYNHDVFELKENIRQLRNLPTNIEAILSELARIREKQGIYAYTGSDELLAGCGDDIEELWFIEYVATLFTSDEYFKQFINQWVLSGQHQKWSQLEIDALINEVTLSKY